MEFVLSWIRNIVVYLILITVILNVVPSDQYKKYIRLFLGFLLTILIARPFLTLFREDSLLNGYFTYYQVMTGKENAIPELKEVEEQRMQAVLEAWKTQIKEALELEAKKRGWHITELEIIWNEESEQGKMKQMQISFEKQNNEDVIVAPIVIQKGETRNSQDAEIKQWKEEIAKQYQVAPNSIIIRQVS